MDKKIKWMQIILESILLILNGIDESEAVSMTARKYNAHESEIYRHGRF